MITGAPWGNVFNVITSKSALDALGLSIIASLASTAIALLFGFPLAWMLARNQFRGKGIVRGLTTLPMVLPLVAVHPGRGHRGRVVRGHAVLQNTVESGLRSMAAASSSALNPRPALSSPSSHRLRCR